MSKFLKCSCCSSGFTLVELMLTVIISTFIIAAIYSAYVLQSRVANNQVTVVELQQNIRAATEILTRDIRMAGYTLSSTGNPGFVDAVTFSNGGSLTEHVFTNASQISFTTDLNGDGIIEQATTDTNGDGRVDMSDMEQISYRMNGTTLERYSTTSGFIEWQDVAENIEKVEFHYLDSKGNATAELDEIESVQISILATANRVDSDFINSKSYITASGVEWSGGNDNFRRRFLVTSIRCRNI